MKKNEKIGRIQVVKDGPYLVFGSLPLVAQKIVPDKDNYLLAWKETKKYPAKKSYSLCRCGKSKTKPFCDGTHVQAGFDGTETADNKSFKSKAEKYVGQDLVLLDAVEYCASAHFCTRAGGKRKE
jgi:CDGSH-type Zn-finger protein